MHCITTFPSVPRFHFLNSVNVLYTFFRNETWVHPEELTHLRLHLVKSYKIARTASQLARKQGRRGGNESEKYARAFYLNSTSVYVIVVLRLNQRTTSYYLIYLGTLNEQKDGI